MYINTVVIIIRLSQMYGPLTNSLSFVNVYGVIMFAIVP